MFCLLYSPKQKIMKFYAQKQIGKSHVIDIFTLVKIRKISHSVFSVSHSLLYNYAVYLGAYKVPVSHETHTQTASE
jgi:hypothetical protein